MWKTIPALFRLLPRHRNHSRSGTGRTAIPTPVAIGGIGGSGTRLVAQIVAKLGYFMGNDLNEALDNLWFTLLFKRPDIIAITDAGFKQLLDIFFQKMSRDGALNTAQLDTIKGLINNDRLQHTTQWLKQRAKTLGHRSPVEQTKTPWAWKEPTTHMVIDRIFACEPSLKYIHVIRNGLDMAYSANRNQLAFWGHHFMPEVDDTPGHALKFWHYANKRALSIGHRWRDRFFLFNFDQVCRNPATCIAELADFIGQAVSARQLETLCRMVKPPKSIERFKRHGLKNLDPEDIAFVKSLGFNIQP
jgi:hypothetical protein